MLSQLPHAARLRLFLDSGHAFMFQYHDLFSRVATGFLAG